MLSGETKSNRMGPNVEVRCKIYTVADVNVRPFSFFRRLCPAVFDSNGKALEKLNSGWTTLKAYGGAIIRQLGLRVIKGIWNNKKWKLIFHTVNAQVQVLLRLRTMKQMGIFIKHPMACIESIDLHSKQAVLSSQLKKG